VQRLTLAIVAIACGACSARNFRRVDDWKFGAVLAYDAEYRRPVPDDEDVAPVDGVADGAIRVRLGGSPDRVGYAAGIDLRAGGSHPGGFAWTSTLFPLGVSGRLGDHGVWGLVGGIGGQGITGRIDAAFAVPGEAYVALRLGPVGVSAWAQPAWIAAGRDQDGPDLRAGMTLRFGKQYHRWGFRSGNGYHLGAVYADQAGVGYVGVMIGYDLDVTSE
jgi:hypothetical protein